MTGVQTCALPISSSNPTYFNFNPGSLQFATSDNIGDLNSWTIESWFRPTADLSSDGNDGLKAILTTVYDDELSGHTGQINYCFTNYNGSGGALNAISVGFFNGNWHLTSPVSVTTGTWYYMSGTYDGSTMSQYYNGSLNSSTGATGPSTANNGKILIGRRWDGNINPIYLFPGDIAVIRIYNTALNSTQISQNFNAERGRFGV